MKTTKTGTGNTTNNRGERAPLERAPLERAPFANVRTTDLPLWHEAFTGLDWLALRLSDTYRGRNVAHGDGSAVVLVPGMFASDATMVELERWLARIGYRPYLSGIGLNARCPDASIERLLETVDRAYAETGHKVRIIGHSLGGLLACGAAQRRPTKVAQVVTLGSPLRGLGAHPMVVAAAELIRGACDGECLDALQRPLPPNIAQSSIYSRGDGVVDWETCIVPGAANVEVRGTHCGLIFNPQAYEALATMLAGVHDRTAAADRRELSVFTLPVLVYGGAGAATRRREVAVPHAAAA